jgi:hypothetical protein
MLHAPDFYDGLRNATLPIKDDTVDHGDVCDLEMKRCFEQMNESVLEGSYRPMTVPLNEESRDHVLIEKFGGKYPFIALNKTWPQCHTCGKLMMFLFQFYDPQRQKETLCKCSCVTEDATPMALRVL